MGTEGEKDTSVLSRPVAAAGPSLPQGDPVAISTQEPPPIPDNTRQRLVAALVTYAQARLAEGQGVELLRQLEADSPEFAAIYQLGYLPPDFAQAIPADAKEGVTTRHFGNSIIAPAFDDGGMAVDFLAVHFWNGQPRANNFNASPSGLIAPRVASAYPDIYLTDSFSVAARFYQTGRQNVMICRGASDAQHNAQRLFGLGVRTAKVMFHRHPEEITAILNGVGIETERLKFPKDGERLNQILNTQPKTAFISGLIKGMGTTPASNAAQTPERRINPLEYPLQPTLKNHDLKMGIAIFTAGDATYQVEASLDAGSRLEVKLERGDKTHIDRFDISSEAQRQRFAISAAMKTLVPVKIIEPHLVFMLGEIRKLQEQLVNPVAVAKAAIQMSDAEKAEALEFLRKPDLLDAIVADLETLGWVGEETGKRLLYIVSASRKLPTPLSAAMLATTGAGKSIGIETLAALTPPEDLVHVSRLTDSALYYQDRDALKNKLLVIDEADAMTPEVLVSLRVLQTRGSLTQSYVLRDPSGQSVTQFCEAKGPVAVLTSTAGKLNEQNLSRCFEIAVDESPEQTQRIVKTKLRLHSDMDFNGASGKRTTIQRRHHNLQRLLSSLPVIIPYADRIEFPASSIKYRRTLEKVLHLIEASALLHQHQRMHQKNSGGEEFIIATVQDFDTAVKLAANSIARAADELSISARDILGLIQRTKLSRFDLNTLKAANPDWSGPKIYRGLEELVGLEVLLTPSRGRGKVRVYEFNPAAALACAAPAVTLAPPSEGELFKLFNGGVNNFTPVSATG